MEKIKYEKPVSLNAGEVASVLGAVCSTGSGAVDGCVAGTDPHSGPICRPGNLATYFCGQGDTNTTGNCENGGTASGDCAVGTSGL